MTKNPDLTHDFSFQVDEDPSGHMTVKAIHFTWTEGVDEPVASREVLVYKGPAEDYMIMYRDYT